MKTSIESVTPEESVVSAARLMRDGNIGFLPVCEEYSGRVLGTITDRDIAMRLVAERRPLWTRVEELMTRDVIACSPDDEIDAAEDLMAENQVSRVMCIDDDEQLVGVISLSDVAQMDGTHAARTLEQVSAREANLGSPLSPAHHRR
ncbi:MAG TPA: CBS domain-containing protein [Steroidobacteraceae bacterium]|jgi:CBS domain-containing protein|nr:CBS domain-containing protein [Steroidobacteraceae bacterium]